jgi:ankyrin repeat protein
MDRHCGILDASMERMRKAFDDQNPCVYLAQHGTVREMKLADKGCLENHKLFHKYVLAAAKGHNLERFLKETGIPVDIREGDSGQTALMSAASCGHSEARQRLLDAGAKVDARILGGNKRSSATELMFACENGQHSCAETLLNAEADVNLGDIADYTALVYACQGGHVECVRLLIKAGAKINFMTKEVNRSDNYP